MFKSRKRKFTKTLKKPVQSSSSEDEHQSAVVKNAEKSQKKNPNLQKTAKRRSFIKHSSEEEQEAPDDLRYESNIQVNHESTKSAKPVPDFHGVFSIKDKYETRMDQDFESQRRKYGMHGFARNTADYYRKDYDTTKEADSIGNLAAALKAGTAAKDGELGTMKHVKKKDSRIAKNTPGHAISHDDNINPETGEKFKGYENYEQIRGKSGRGLPDATYSGRMDEENGELLYKGGKQYTDWNPMQKKDPGTKLIRAVRGPVRAPTFMRVTTRWDYEKSLCRDWKECGYCVFGDCCKYIHDRSDLKHGWELEDKWMEMNDVVESDNDYTVSSADEDGEDLPFKCFICRNSYVEPIETLCKHYFCLKCAMNHYSKTQKCYICNKNTKGVFNPAKRIMARLDRMAVDGIDVEDKKNAFGNGAEHKENSGSDNENELKAENEPDSRVIKFDDHNHRAFITAGGDTNIDQEEEIENEIELEEALIAEFGEKGREDDSDNEGMAPVPDGLGEDSTTEEEKEEDEDGKGPSKTKKKRFTTEQLKEILNDAEKRDKKDKFDTNLGRFLPKEPFKDRRGHQTTETLSLLKHVRKVTDYETEQ